MNDDSMSETTTWHVLDLQQRNDEEADADSSFSSQVVTVCARARAMSTWSFAEKFDYVESTRPRRGGPVALFAEWPADPPRRDPRGIIDQFAFPFSPPSHPRAKNGRRGHRGEDIATWIPSIFRWRFAALVHPPLAYAPVAHSSFIFFFSLHCAALSFVFDLSACIFRRTASVLSSDCPGIPFCTRRSGRQRHDSTDVQRAVWYA